MKHPDDKHDPVAQICHETRMLRLRAAELGSQATNVTEELRQALEQRHALLKRLRENQDSLDRTLSRDLRGKLQSAGQWASSR